MIGCTENTRKVPVISDVLAKNHSNSLNDSLFFYNHLNEKITLESFKGKVHVVNFFFTTCKTICPLMENNLNNQFVKESNIQFVSFSIDPKNDSVPTLKKHHLSKGNPKNWMFLTGSQTNLECAASLYLSTIKGVDEVNANLFHTSYVVLVDKKMQIRGLYDSLDGESLEFLEKDINTILMEK